MTLATRLPIVLLALAPLAYADVPLRATRIATGLSKPLFVTSAPGDPNRLFVVEQGGSGTLASTGFIKIFDYSSGTLNSTPFLSIPGLATGNEQGLLGLAFDPNYATNGKFYAHMTLSNGSIEIRQYSRAAGTFTLANSTPDQSLLTIPHPGQSNHNGGWIGFKPGANDGNLYIGVGDGGGGNDTPNNAQTITNNLLGKMLRVNVNGDDFPGDSTRNYKIPANNPFVGTTGDDEIWNYGLRNPWRSSFDRKTGDLYIGDVGQDTAEEIDFQPTNSPGGLNFGWRKYEGANLRPGGGASDVLGGPSPHTPPIHEYPHNGGGKSITGGYVYRDDENPALDGTYLFAEFISNQIWSFKYDGSTKTKFRELTGTIATDGGTINSISSFGEDAQGRMYILDRGGEIFRLIPPTPGDANLDDKVDIRDLYALATNWQQGSTELWANGDFTDDGFVDANDLALLARNWQQGVGSPSLLNALTSLGLPTDVVPEPGRGLVMVLLATAMSQARVRRARHEHLVFLE